ncbi:MAG: hypothetical protein A3F72_06910 [Bacteroidetes bacterium RIFCSPLOWO2_12_FULL_35_15]|nr:MAG: hypothetical protein A3F72_06910 [Bacteroidetes bacterium RIFCSPLOWO2_12_FULL_35_15]
MKNTVTKSKSKNDTTQGLRNLFVAQLKDIYWAEKALTKAIPKMIKNVTSAELNKALTSHLKQTEEQVTRLEDLFSTIGKKAIEKKSDAMAGLIKEAKRIIKENKRGIVRDAGIILAGQKVEHYEIATYGTLLSFAKTLGENEAVALLEKSLNEEKSSNEKLSQIAVASINKDATEENKKADEFQPERKEKRKELSEIEY